MDNNYLDNGHTSMAVTLLFGLFTWISSENVGEIVKVFSGIISGVAGLMAIRYYYYATKKKRK